ncbi:MAG: ABC-F family ATP-binding cassette domain-containing protein [Flavobacteriales bacterium]|nr:ABC-F family ATP-binding cassette domain-containing protein [Flavobacteriales bacterium]MCW8912066.1 ABC-F family ATP-binding cassette domain-containing protein [Flavobacteriales bacterium]MCW8936706.1 ABC-F family ATP-binding cassette domain-containing protein [Flavobacteriales bacterium]MCW8941467.1 ABC-F family ATP-binding cassette domain-containing protein [Flavobacteriales bacterium]MCW8967111.1 ABC-F family ATP-binding cassette domain-containing protein [Flavobacteriales bacterium]
MNYLSVENLSKSFGERVLFENISFGIDKGQKVAFIAKNGTGKSTLLKILAGEAGYDSGNVVFRNGIKTGILQQSPNYNDELTISQTIFRTSSEQIDAILEYEKAIANPDDNERMQKAFEQMDALDAWDYEVRIKQILGQLQIHDLEQKIGELSGGQQKRIALAQVLIEEPDFIILDEPTNHLDLDMIEWLENYLIKDNITILMVTHDRYFLERVCNEIIELDEKTLYRYKGNYSYFLEKKEERESIFAANVDKAKNLYRKELEWMRRMPKARGTKAKSREDAFYDTEKVAKQKKDNSKVEMEVNMTRLGGKILELHHVKKSFGDLKILEDFNYVFKKQEKIGIVGKNGVGKTTFLNILLGLENIDGGKVVSGETVVYGYYTQKGMQFKEEKKVIEVIKDIAEVIPLTKGKSLTAAQLLEKFLFPKSMHYNQIAKLSGGEKRRLYLLTILIKNPNFLILDEPTNDLDVMTLSVLEDFLEDFQGCLIIVTHDRYFMDKLVDHLFIFEGDGKVNDYLGRYSDYREELKQQQVAYKKAETTKANKNAENTSEKVDTPKVKLTYKEKIELEQLDKDIEALEKKKAELMKVLEANQANHEEIIKITTELGEISTQLDKKGERWLYLSDFEF